MCGIIGGAVVTTVGAVLTVVVCIVGFQVIPQFVENMIVQEVILIEDTDQMDRFQEVPIPLNFSVIFFNISNPEEVLSGGVPILNEVGPYVYKLRQRRLLDSFEDDVLYYRRQEDFEFSPEYSNPCTEDDIVTIVNPSYHAVLQVAEKTAPNLMIGINLAMNGIFGEYNSPVTNIRVRDLLFDGIPMCVDTNIISAIACNQIRANANISDNLVIQDDGSVLFSVFAFKDGVPSQVYEIFRGQTNTEDLGKIITYDGQTRLTNWPDENLEPDQEYSECNALRGTDAGIFAPFMDRSEPFYVFNSDICRSIEVRYKQDSNYEGIPTFEYTVEEWFLDNHEGCFCSNETIGLTSDDGCLLTGAMELYPCVSAFLVLTYPHFLYADPAYQNGVIGMNPDIEKHQISLELEPLTSTVVKGFKRAQFNIFMRPVTSISATQNLLTTLTPIIWIEESMVLPEEYVDELKTKLISTLRLIDILVPVIVAVCCAILLIGVIVTIRAKLNQKKSVDTK